LYEEYVKLCFKESVKISSKLLHIEEDSDEFKNYIRNIQTEIFKDLIRRYDKEVILF